MVLRLRVPTKPWLTHHWVDAGIVMARVVNDQGGPRQIAALASQCPPPAGTGRAVPFSR